ncbi:hypothetical protein L9F63_022734, partial [Diploptera punctata]
MRGKQQSRGQHLGPDDDEDDFVSVKTRPPTPVLDGCGGGGGGGGTAGFWLAAVTAAAGGPPHGVHPMDGCLTSETGFINSQPSMAEFMTALPQLTGEIHPPPPGSLSPPPGSYQGMVDSHGQPPPGQQPPPPGVNVPEYPWMKEKKTTRKSNQQGLTTKPRSHRCSIHFITTVYLEKENKIKIIYLSSNSDKKLVMNLGCKYVQLKAQIPGIIRAITSNGISLLL